MINILPERGRIHARHMYWLRFASILLWAASFALLVAAALLSTIYFDARASENAARAESAGVEGTGAKGREMEAPLAAAAAYIEAYTPLLSEGKVSDHVALVLAARPTGITLVNLSYEKTSGRLSLSGLAGTREDLLSFERGLKATRGIASVDLPVGDLAKSAKVSFSLSVTFAPKNNP